MDKKYFIQSPEQLCEVNSLRKLETHEGPSVLSLVRVWTVAERQEKAEIFKDHIYIHMTIAEGVRMARLVRISPTGKEEKLLAMLKFPQTLKYCKENLKEI